MTRTAAGISVLLLTALPLFVQAQVYKCVDPKTKATSYGSTICATGDVSQVSITENAIIDSKVIYQDAYRQQQEEATQQRAAAASGYAPNSATGSQNSGDRDRLANECYRGFKTSCRKLPSANSAAGDTLHGPTFDTRDRLSAECARGIKSSCGSLSALNRAATASQPSSPASPTWAPPPKVVSSQPAAQPTTKQRTSPSSSVYSGNDRYEIQKNPSGYSLGGSTEIEMRKKYDYDPSNKYRGEVERDGSVRMKNYNGDVVRGNIERGGYGRLKDSDGNTYRVKPY